MFEIYMMASEIHNNIGLGLGIKHFVHFVANLGMKYLKFMFLNRPIPVFPVNKVIVMTKQRTLIKVDA